jgi:hypothetical protein
LIGIGNEIRTSSLARYRLLIRRRTLFEHRSHLSRIVQDSDGIRSLDVSDGYAAKKRCSITVDSVSHYQPRGAMGFPIV